MWRTVLVVLGCAALLSAQTPAEKRQADLLDRAREETHTAIEDAQKLDRYERPVAFARLVEIWTPTGHPELADWKQRALNDLMKRRGDHPEEDRQRLVSAAIVLSILDPIDRKAADKVLDNMTSGLTELGDSAHLTTPERAQLRPVGSALATVAIRFVDTDPARAGALARTIMSVRDGDALGGVLEKLRKTRPDLAKSIMADAAESAGATQDPIFIAGLVRQLLIAKQKNETAYPQLYPVLLQAMNGALMHIPGNAIEREESCMLTRVVPQFAAATGTKPPATLDEATARCRDVRTLEDPPPQIKGKISPSADDYLDAANTAIEARDRAAFRMQAALMFAPRDPVRALAIASELANDEKKAYPGWRRITLAIANAAVMARHRAEDATGVQQVLDSVPAPLRAVVEVNAANWARRQRDETAFAIAMLKAGRRAVDKKTVDDSEMLVGLLNGYAALMPIDAHKVVEEVAEFVNALPHPPSFWKDPAEALMDITRYGTQSGPPVPVPGYEVRPAKFDNEVVDIPEIYWDVAMKRIDDHADLLAFRLGLIRKLLEIANNM